jgi:hypothetical protein
LLGAGGLGPALRVPSAKTGTSNFRRSRRDRAPYTIWRDQGLLVATEGNTTDFQFIEVEILALASRFVVTELAYDRTFAGEIVRNLQDEGLSLVGPGLPQHGAGRRGIPAPFDWPGAAAWGQPDRHLVRVKRQRPQGSGRQ